MLNSTKELVNFKRKLIEFQTFSDDNSCMINYNYSFDKELFNFLGKYDIPLKREYTSETEHIIGVLLWMKNNTSHNGYVSDYINLNSRDLLKWSITNNQGINCLMLAIVLQEIYTYFGYYSFIVRGNPYDYKILDNHWHVHVYSNQQKKWIMMDPSWCAFCYDGEKLLSIDEIREYLINNYKFEIFNECLLTKNNYYYLLCRYLFHFERFINNGFNTFRESDQRKISLSPVGFDAQEYSKKRFEIENNTMGHYLNIYKSHNDNCIYTKNKDMFWATF